MSSELMKIKSISELHRLSGLKKPKHPLISLIDASKIQVTENEINAKIIYDFYMISLKDRNCGVDYGRNSFDFDEGVMVFSAPQQVYTPTKIINKGRMNFKAKPFDRANYAGKPESLTVSIVD